MAGEHRHDHGAHAGHSHGISAAAAHRRLVESGRVEVATDA